MAQQSLMSSPSPEGYQNIDTIFYKHGNQIVQKRSWRDPTTGEEWPTFDVVATGTYDWLNDGDTVDPTNLSDPRQSAAVAPQTTKTPKAPKAKKSKQPTTTASGMPAGTYGGNTTMAQTPWTPKASSALESHDPNAGATPSNDLQRARNQMQFDPQSIGALNAFDNALINKGVNPYRSNPLLQRMRRMAPGAEAAFLMQQAQAGTNPETADMGANFLDFISANMGDMGGALMRARQGLPGFLGNIQEYESQLAGGSPQYNPLMEYLRDRFQQGRGEGYFGTLGALTAPMMSAQLANSYSEGLQQQTGALQRRMGSTIDPLEDTDIWDYILGRR